MENYLEMLQRLQADFENFKRHAKRQLGESERRGQLEAVRALVPAITNLRRALDSAKVKQAPEPFIEGLENIYTQFLDRLAQLEVYPIDAVGKAFDPERHDAVDTMASDAAPGLVLEEVETGYRAGDETLLPAKVIVSA